MSAGSITLPVINVGASGATPYGFKDPISTFGGQASGLGNSLGFPIANPSQAAQSGILSPGAELAIGVLSFVALEAVTGILTTTVVGSPLAVLAQTAATARLLSLASKAKSFFAGFRTSKRGKRIVNLGGEGEVPGKGVINVQPGKIGAGSSKNALEEARLNALDVRSRIDKQPGSIGQPIVRADGDRLPFGDKSIDKVILNGAPLDAGKTHFGPSFTTREINRILKDGGEFILDGIRQQR
ncbi:MAG: class I SAM-dependent methyltransferase [Candidatus Nitronauta litoralis]|uniref:Class I SAM-dependent methyltransferase n=1 Tax=Candidatus Nitronauta litoralis TaxID=2705533 RepID=A0A7T0BV65_9BACT|nr:MAG: class I SAM-dependent methyltransferase [Candidatus Nitronauta litoralis]